MRLIDADQFILAIMDASLSSVDEDTILDLVDNVPTVDAAPVVHGRWERRRNVWYCTNCGKGYKITYGAVAANMHNYCPHCGAVMDGGADND